MTKAERAAAMRAKYKALGLCYYCKTTPFVVGGSMCGLCSDKRKEYISKRTASLLASGICYTCAKRPRVEGQRHCVECASRHAVNSQKKRARFKAVGICPMCRQEKLVAGGRGGASRCPKCYEKEAIRSKRNYEAVKAAGLCASCFKEPQAEGKTYCSGCIRRRLLARFAEQGLTEAQLDAMGDKCEVCDSTENLHIDHDHDTNVIRGLLCQLCNHALGSIKEDPMRILRLLAYVNKHKPQQFSDKFYRGQRWTKTEPSLSN